MVEPDPEVEPDPVVEPDPEADPGLLPSSPFYFLKRFVENIRVWFTFNAERKTALLGELVNTRALELEALEEKFSETELTEAQQQILQKASEDLETAAEGLFKTLLGDGENLEDMELTEEGLTQLETALVNLGLALDNIIEAEDPEDPEVPEDPVDPLDPEDPEDPEDDDDDECPDNLSKWEKYEWRIHHLEEIRDRNPESCHDGLNRAIENARRQQRRWAEKNGYPLPEEDEEDIAPIEDVEDAEVDEELVEKKNKKNGKGNNGNKNKDKNKNKNKNKPNKGN